MDFSVGTGALNSYDAVSRASEQLSGTLERDYKNATDEELMSACKEFESYFLEQVFKGMQKMVPKSETESSYTSTIKEYYQDELIKNYAADAANQGEGLGIAQMLYEQMKRNIDNG